VVTELFETKNARAAGLFVAGTDVYVAGYFTNAQDNLAACYWLNGAPTVLYSDETGTFDARATSVYVSGADVYVAGYIDEAGKEPGYWKNETWVPLGATAGEATDIVVSGTDVYVAGSVTPSADPRACYWKNGVREPLDDLRYSQSLGIAVSGTDVYVAGYYVDGGLKAALWHNDSAGLATLSSSGAKAFDVTVNETDVFAAGYYTNGSSKNVACYWKNGSVVDLYNDAVNAAQAGGIFVLGSDVYVAGYVDAGTRIACYWRNGSRTPFATAISECYSLALQD
jgi:hypothetical protein